MNIAVYCSSYPHLDQACTDMAEALGRWIGEHGHTLVYGGVNAGLMHTTAKACAASGGKVLGVITRNFAPMADPLVDELLYTENLNERKAKMYEISDLHVVLPGGIGTIDEWFSALSQWVVDKREGVGMIIANNQGMYDPLLEQMRWLAQSRFAGVKHLKAMAVVPDTEALISKLDSLHKDSENEK